MQFSTCRASSEHVSAALSLSHNWCDHVPLPHAECLGLRNSPSPLHRYSCLPEEMPTAIWQILAILC